MDTVPDANPVIGSPPPARGAPSFAVTNPELLRITPACAGSTDRRRTTHRPSSDDPRLRGEHETKKIVFEGEIGSPPPARGARFFTLNISRDERVTPACAGNTRPRRPCRCPAADHPRLRGEHTGWRSSVNCLNGSPPLARGARDDLLGREQLHRVPQPARGAAFDVVDLEREVRITPACAGSTVLWHFALRRHSDHPRLCGEHGHVPSGGSGRSGSPPRPRGAHRDQLSDLPNDRITPACAGITTPAPS